MRWEGLTMLEAHTLVGGRHFWGSVLVYVNPRGEYSEEETRAWLRQMQMRIEGPGKLYVTNERMIDLWGPPRTFKEFEG